MFVRLNVLNYKRARQSRQQSVLMQSALCEVEDRCCEDLTNKCITVIWKLFALRIISVLTFTRTADEIFGDLMLIFFHILDNIHIFQIFGPYSIYIYCYLWINTHAFINLTHKLKSEQPKLPNLKWYQSAWDPRTCYACRESHCLVWFMGRWRQRSILCWERRWLSYPCQWRWISTYCGQRFQQGVSTINAIKQPDLCVDISDALHSENI